MKFLISESFHRLKEVMTVLRGKLKKQAVLEQEQPRLQFLKERHCYQFSNTLNPLLSITDQRKQHFVQILLHYSAIALQ